MLAALMQERWVRSGVRIKPTSVSADVNGMGLYAPAAERAAAACLRHILR